MVLRKYCKFTEFSYFKLKEMSIILTVNDLVFSGQQILSFFTVIFLQCNKSWVLLIVMILAHICARVAQW